MENNLISDKFRDILINDCTTFDEKKEDKNSFFIKKFLTPIKNKFSRNKTIIKWIAQNTINFKNDASNDNLESIYIFLIKQLLLLFLNIYNK